MSFFAGVSPAGLNVANGHALAVRLLEHAAEVVGGARADADHPQRDPFRGGRPVLGSPSRGRCEPGQRRHGPGRQGTSQHVAPRQFLDCFDIVCLPFSLRVHGVLALLMPAGTPERRADESNLDRWNVPCQTPPPQKSRPSATCEGDLPGHCQPLSIWVTFETAFSSSAAVGENCHEQAIGGGGSMASWGLHGDGGLGCRRGSPGRRLGHPPRRPRLAGSLDASGASGGLVVHVGCGDGKLTAALRAGDGYLVQGLDSDARKVAEARRYLRSLGLYGPVSIERFDGKRLPYVDNLVTLIVAEDLASVPRDELMRVLSPGGVACVLSGGQWTKTVKPRPAEIDQWTHFLHDASNNAVSADSVVGPPRQLQWVGGPPWTRSHDHLAGVSAAVCAGGRLFYVVDEGPIAAVVLEPKWQLVACDAFSGVILWKRSIPQWQWHLRGFRSGPTDLARRLVAVDDRVYVTLGSDAPLSALDAATGQTLTTYAGTEHTLEVALQGRALVVAGASATEEEKARRRGDRPGLVEVRSQRPPYAENYPPKRILAIDAASGRPLWNKSDGDTAELLPTTLAVSGGRVFFQNAEKIACLDAASGKPVWRVPRRWLVTGRPGRPRRWSSTKGLCSRRTGRLDHPGGKSRGASCRPDGLSAAAGGQSPVGELIAFSARTGERCGTARAASATTRRWTCSWPTGWSGPAIWSRPATRASPRAATPTGESPTHAARRSAVLPTRHGPPALLSQQGDLALAGRRPIRRGVRRSGHRQRDPQPLDPRRLPVRRDPLQRAALRAAALLCLFHHRQAQWLQLPGPGGRSGRRHVEGGKGRPRPRTRCSQQSAAGTGARLRRNPNSNLRIGKMRTIGRPIATTPARSGRAGARSRRSSSRPGRRTSAGS